MPILPMETMPFNQQSRFIITGHVFSKRIKITSQVHIRKFEEQTIIGQVPCWMSENDPKQGTCPQVVHSSSFRM